MELVLWYERYDKGSENWKTKNKWVQRRVYGGEGPSGWNRELEGRENGGVEEGDTSVD